ncbi:MAG: hypothetical protein LAT82_00920 [Nanoarchaeota archaeon]|nr:hypothetical protein [Nanoarchaeota archaeon]
MDTQINAKLFEKSYAKIHSPTYHIYVLENPLQNAFINIVDEDEITCITTQEIENFKEKNENWIRVSIFIDAPPQSKGIAAILTHQFATYNISIVPIASFSKAHIFIQKKDLNLAKKCLKSLNITII